MGLDLVVLQNERPDGTDDWPGHAVDSRRADDYSPEVMEKLRELYDDQFSPAGMAASAEFEEWGVPSPKILFIPFYPIYAYQQWQAKRRDAARTVPTFEDWRADLCARDPAPIALQFSPNCPPGGEPDPAAVVQYYGFRGKVVEAWNNLLVRWWAAKNSMDLDIIFYNEKFPDGPQETDDVTEIDELDANSIGDMAALFARIEADCVAAFPELVTAADAKPWQEAEFGPYPEHDLDEIASPVDLTCIRGARRFFEFWEGRGYEIAPDY